MQSEEKVNISQVTNHAIRNALSLLCSSDEFLKKLIAASDAESVKDVIYDYKESFYALNDGEPKWADAPNVYAINPNSPDVSENLCKRIQVNLHNGQWKQHDNGTIAKSSELLYVQPLYFESPGSNRLVQF